MFSAQFDKVDAIVARTVNREGRIPRMSEHKTKRVFVVIPECDDPQPDMGSYQTQFTPDEIDARIGVSIADPTTEDIMEAAG